MVAMLIAVAPLASSTAPQASRVAPVVSTSSTTRIRRPLTSAALPTSNTVATFSQRWARFFLVWVAVWMVRRRSRGAPRQAESGGQALGKHRGLVVAPPAELARVQRHGHDDVELGIQPRGQQLGAIELPEHGANFALALVLQLVEQVLDTAVPQKPHIAQRVLHWAACPRSGGPGGCRQAAAGGSRCKAARSGSRCRGAAHPAPAAHGRPGIRGGKSAPQSRRTGKAAWR
jgi:hypothetical protein